MSGNSHHYLKAFKMVNKNHSGVSDRQKLIEVLVSQCKEMEQTDLNGNGIIHLGEYKIASGIPT
ncbi:unnamed protein product [Hymenolepis diminuta]|uniref:EF-hand domain-containing protein n=1 Tax=Hymenolepis diminuta TaxID=6216 RepID=A0A0R3STQ0_HYMDI|nr:unnamed protein product [Hymenolepis diminuta]